MYAAAVTDWRTL